MPPAWSPMHETDHSRRMGGHAFTILLAAQAAFLLTMVIVHEASGDERGLLQAILGFAGFTCVLLAGVYLAIGARVGRWLLPLAVAAVGLDLTNIFLHRTDLRLVSRALWMAFLSYTAFVGLRFLFTTRIVTGNMISAAFCAYCLLALIWAGLYATVEQLSPGAFNVPLTMSFGDIEGWVTTLYFSYVTMLTLGYGEIVPVSPTARFLIIIQTVSGQILLLVLVARLVGLQIAQRVEQG